MDEVKRIANTILRLVDTNDDAEVRARATADRLIQEHVGPDHPVMDMKALHAALVQALTTAAEQ